MHKYILKHGKHENECEHMFCLMCDGDLVYYTSCMNKTNLLTIAMMGLLQGPRPRKFTKSSVPIGQEHKLGPRKSMMEVSAKYTRTKCL